MQLDYLVTMANQIADFWVSESGPDAAASDIASHITRFWDPRMRAAIIAHAQAGGAGLQPAALAAVRALKPVAVPAASVAG
jgi:formate dehydrogenase subunit delta